MDLTRRLDRLEATQAKRTKTPAIFEPDKLLDNIERAERGALGDGMRARSLVSLGAVLREIPKTP